MIVHPKHCFFRVGVILGALSSDPSKSMQPSLMQMRAEVKIFSSELLCIHWATIYHDQWLPQLLELYVERSLQHVIRRFHKATGYRSPTRNLSLETWSPSFIGESSESSGWGPVQVTGRDRSLQTWRPWCRRGSSQVAWDL